MSWVCEGRSTLASTSSQAASCSDSERRSRRAASANSARRSLAADRAAMNSPAIGSSTQAHHRDRTLRKFFANPQCLFNGVLIIRIEHSWATLGIDLSVLDVNRCRGVDNLFNAYNDFHFNPCKKVKMDSASMALFHCDSQFKTGNLFCYTYTAMNTLLPVTILTEV